MKVLLYTEGLKTVGKSGLGHAVRHQMNALESNEIEYTTDPSELDSVDIVHINWYLLKSYFLAKEAKKRGKKVVYHAHSTEEDFRNSFLFSNQLAPLFKWWICKCYRLGDVIITPTEYSKKILLSYRLDKPIYAISNGIDTSFFERHDEYREEFLNQYSFSKKDKIIMGVGLFLKRKGILDFVELARRMPEYQFIWFGYLDLKLVPKEIRSAVSNKLDNLTFAGYVEQEFLRKAYSSVDLYLFPTLEETEGIPILEALVAKTPTLVRDIPVFEEFITDKEVYKAKDIDEFEEKIRKILNGTLPDLTEVGYQKAIQKDIKVVGTQLVQVYQDLIQDQ